MRVVLFISDRHRVSYEPEDHNDAPRVFRMTRAQNDCIFEQVLLRDDLNYRKRNRLVFAHNLLIRIPKFVYQLKQDLNLILHSVDTLNITGSCKDWLNPLFFLTRLNFCRCCLIGEK